MRKPRYKHPAGKYVYIEWECYPSFEAVHGHVDAATFAATLRAQGQDWVDETVKIEHAWMRHNPDPSGSYDSIVELVPGPGRGHSPVTIARC